nr:hypothetical protein [uncultured Albidiferax sp.]
MSWLNWFSRKSPPAPAAPASSVFPDRTGPDSQQDSRLRDTRIDRRERLYGVVRASLIEAGVLTSSYKFKVLALDDQGQQFLVMVDLAPSWTAVADWRTRIESKIIHAAQAEHGLVITSVYWRNNADLAASPMSRPGVLSSPDAAVSSQPATLATGGRYEPIQADEVAAFHQALEAASRMPSVPRKIH